MDAGLPPPGRRSPLWVATPTRFAAMSRGAARTVAVLLVVLLLLSLTALRVADPAAGAASSANGGDLAMYEGVIAGLRGGGDYYELTAQALRAGDYPLKPFVTFRPPTHAVVQAALPGWAIVPLLHLLALGVACAWWIRLRAILLRPSARVALALLLAAGLAAFVQAELAAFHELWSALLVALALAIYRTDRWIEAAAIGLIAALVRETAALFPIVMAGFAWREGRRREFGGWLVALLAFALALVAHARGVAGVVDVVDPASPGWSGLLGPGFFVRALVSSTGLSALPLPLAAPVVALALFGWTAWAHPLAARAAVLFLGYAAAIAVFARADTFYWALMPAPVLLAGLIFVPDALRDLSAALLDRRRVRVHRVVR